MRGVSGFRRKAEHSSTTCVDYHLDCSRLWRNCIASPADGRRQQKPGHTPAHRTKTYRRPSEHRCLEKMILFFGGNSPNLSERFYFLRYVGLAVCGKTQNQSPQRPSSMDNTDLISDLKPRAYKPPAETRRVFACASSGRSERMPSQFFSN